MLTTEREAAMKRSSLAFALSHSKMCAWKLPGQAHEKALHPGEHALDKMLATRRVVEWEVHVA